jgi:hypothetical protein
MMINHNNLVFMELLQVVKIIITAKLLQRLAQLKLEEVILTKKVTFQIIITEVKWWRKFQLYMLSDHVQFWINLVKVQINLRMLHQIIQVT